MMHAMERVMVVTAHPDDPEFGAGGTIAKLAAEGREISYVIVTDGGKGTADRALSPAELVRIREQEQRSAARVLGVERVEFLGYEDGELEDTRRLRLDVTRQIRRWRPGLVITQHPARSKRNFFGWHRDHRITGAAVLDCVYPLARDHLAFPELSEHEPHAVPEVYLIQWDEPGSVLDITETIALKLAAATCHRSQGTQEAIEARVRGRSAALGKPHGYAYAEGFDRVVVGG
jgi:LmbE family N-acetylglucosaminyl deacetylase